MDDEAFTNLEQLLYEADLGPQLAMEMVDKVKAFARKHPHFTSEECIALIHGELLSLFPPSPVLSEHRPTVILLVGVNGSGKTTSLAKLAHHFQSEGKKVLIAAGDTFRAAAIEQLEIWAQKVGVPIIKSQRHGDPSGLTFDAIAAGIARQMDIVLIDTAGRLQTKTDLMQELAKVHRVCQKQLPSAPHETFLVIDATIGQNALDQAKAFHAVTPLTGIILTKLDGSAKGGIAVAIQKELRIPIRYIGTGEGEGDFAPFDPKSYLDALLE
ncbi:MAG: signal recognition particle-docking protein FtsY [Chlamydiia bacterium]|nr:signal recognition particle-docking protein FtsY [Chlamydiia bacterium]